MYLGMGWACLLCLPQMAARLVDERECVLLILLGGVAYTAGVPFFVRNNNLDHAIWHLFVMTGSFLHWIAIYYYVAKHPLEIDIPI
jgi:hemolysin III